MTANTESGAGRLARILAQQHNVIARRQALACGVTTSALRHRLTENGSWRKILPGVYATGTGTVSPEQREVAALLYAGPRAVITGAMAVRRHRLRCAGLNEIDVLVPAAVRRQSAGFLRIQHTTRMPERIWSAGPIRFAPLPRAVADAARGMKRLDDVQALVCEAVQKGSCTLEQLIGELDAGPSPGSRWYRQALAEYGAGTRSSAEKDLKHLIDRSDLEKPMYNPRLYAMDGTFLGMPDVWWQRAGVAAEVDSLQYHLSAKDHEATMARHNRMEAAGLHMLHFLPRSITSEQRTILASLRGAIKAGHRNPPLPIVAVRADETDDAAYLTAQLGSLQGT
jgi:hypothetical protein